MSSKFDKAIKLEEYLKTAKKHKKEIMKNNAV